MAKGRVDVVVMSKRDFQDLDNPLLAWMIDYDAVATVLKVLALPNVAFGLVLTFKKLSVAAHSWRSVIANFLRWVNSLDWCSRAMGSLAC